MGQFDSQAEAAQARLQAEDLSATLATRIPGVALDIADWLLELIETPQSSPATGSWTLLKGGIGALKIIANHRFTSRIEYLLECLVGDLKGTLSTVDKHEDRLKLVEAKLRTARFEELLAEAAVQAVRATDQGKVQRLARVVVSGTVDQAGDPIERALEFERHAVELKDLDISLLSLMQESQAPLREAPLFQENEWIDGVRQRWQEMVRMRGYGEAANALEARSSFARLQARGLIAQISGTKTINSPGTEPYAILDEGSRFLLYLAGYLSG